MPEKRKRGRREFNYNNGRNIPLPKKKLFCKVSNYFNCATLVILEHTFPPCGDRIFLLEQKRMGSDSDVYFTYAVRTIASVCTAVACIMSYSLISSVRHLVIISTRNSAVLSVILFAAL